VKPSYEHLGPYSDLVAAANRSRRLYPLAKPGRKTRRLFCQTLGFAPGPEVARTVRIERHWTRDGIDGEEISWWVGYGPRTKAWLLRPAGVKSRLPGIVALHDHGAFKFYGKEKVAEGPDNPPAVIHNFWNHYYGGRAFPNALAREGFAVLVHDTFSWGSRKFPLESMPMNDRLIGKQMAPIWGQDDPSQRWSKGHDAKRAAAPRHALQIAEYNACSWAHEHSIAKYCNVLGISFPGIVSFEDRIAVNYLSSRPDVDGRRIGCVGLSGGGTRAVLLQGSCDRICCAVSVGAMCTYDGLLDHNVLGHTWMLFPPGWARYGDWADIAACRAPSPLMVQNDWDDPLYTVKGMKDAHRRIAAAYKSVGKPRNYVGEFYPGPHKFDLPMQRSAFAWLGRWLRR
jgi:dienelactone hydrolase